MTIEIVSFPTNRMVIFHIYHFTILYIYIWLVDLPINNGYMTQQ